MIPIPQRARSPAYLEFRLVAALPAIFAERRLKLCFALCAFSQ